LTDVVLEKRYKEEYLKYIQGGNMHGKDSQNNKMHQSMLDKSATHDEEAQRFDNMLQTKQDEIILESLKVIPYIYPNHPNYDSKLTRRSFCSIS